MNEFTKMISDNIVIILIGVIVLIIILFGIYAFLLSKKLKLLNQKYGKFMSGAQGEGLEAVLLSCLNKIEGEEMVNKEQNKRIKDIYNRLMYCTQKTGFLRYNAFNNVGSDQSYSIAFLDQTDTGVILSGIYGREHSTTYSKSVEKGQSKYPLSDEEEKALALAKEEHIKHVGK